ncbi:hypothetical protein HDU97_007597 [Phlyctochytrium planicorne]|nr:hypothetical protein HDU97_007597 [Phlyctochytrium planicorne]
MAMPSSAYLTERGDSASYLPIHEIPLNDVVASSHASQRFVGSQRHLSSQGSDGFGQSESICNLSISPSSSMQFLERNRSFSDPMPRIPEDLKYSPTSPLSGTSASASGTQVASWEEVLARPRANSNVSVYSNASSNISMMTEETATRTADILAESDYADGEIDRASPGPGKVGKSRKSYTCPVDSCGKLFGRSSHLSRHYKSTHSAPFAFKCPMPMCGKRFSRSDILKKHVKVHSAGQSSLLVSTSTGGLSEMFTIASNDQRATSEGTAIKAADSMVAAMGQSFKPTPPDRSYSSEASQNLPVATSYPPPLTIGARRESYGGPGSGNIGLLTGNNLAATSVFQYPTPMQTPIASPSPSNLHFTNAASSTTPVSAQPIPLPSTSMGGGSGSNSFVTTLSASSMPATTAAGSILGFSWNGSNVRNDSSLDLQAIKALQHSTNYSQQPQQFQQSNPAMNSTSHIVVPSTRDPRSLLLLQPTPSSSSTLQYHTHKLPLNFQDSVKGASYSSSPTATAQGQRKDEGFIANSSGFQTQYGGSNLSDLGYRRSETPSSSFGALSIEGLSHPKLNYQPQQQQQFQLQQTHSEKSQNSREAHVEQQAPPSFCPGDVQRPSSSMRKGSPLDFLLSSADSEGPIKSSPLTATHQTSIIPTPGLQIASSTGSLDHQLGGSLSKMDWNPPPNGSSSGGSPTSGSSLLSEQIRQQRQQQHQQAQKSEMPGLNTSSALAKVPGSSPLCSASTPTSVYGSTDSQQNQQGQSMEQAMSMSEEVASVMVGMAGC